MGTQTPKRRPVGVSAFLTPSLVLAATVATALRQLGVPVGGLSFAVWLYLVLDLLAFRFRRAQPGLERLQQSSSNTTVAAAQASASADGATKKTQSQEASGGAPATERSGQQAVSGPPAKPATATTSAVAAQTAGLRLSMLGEDIYVNAESPFEFENDFFKGRMLFLVKCNPPDPKWAAHFEGSNSNRAFEMQIQGKLKLLPKGEVYMGGELDERPKQGLVTQTVSKIVMSFAKQMVKSLHYSFGERRPPSDPLDVENPHVTFPLYRVMDWFVVTGEDEKPPTLGGALTESAEERAARRGGKSPDIVWSTDVTYTMAFQSGIVNFQDWAVTDVPGQGNLDLNTFLCKQPVSVVVYDFTAANPSAATHKARDKSYMFRCTISNDSPGQLARSALAAVAAQGPAASPAAAAGGVGTEKKQDGGGVEQSEDGVGLSGSPGDTGTSEVTMAGIFDPSDEQPEQDKDKERGGRASSTATCGLPRFDSTGYLSGAISAGGLSSVSQLAAHKSYYVPAVAAPDEKEVSGKGLVKSGVVLPLLMGGVGENRLQQSPTRQSTSTSYHDFLGEGNGGRVAMRRGTAMPAGLQVVKVGGGEGTFRSDYLYDGDVIVLHHPESRKFVRIGRGWALGWSSKGSASKIHFVVSGIEPSRPLAHGQAFFLRSRKWPDWKVGVARQTSTKVGGRGLGCFNKGKRRNTTRLSLLTLVARPWFDPDKEGVIPALEAEADAITISVRGPFEDLVSEEDEGDEEEEEEDAKSEVDEGEYDSDVDRTEVDRGLKTQTSLSEDGISAKAARAMQCYPEHVTSLRVSVPAWVEFLHRERRQGQLAFLLAVHATVPPPPSSTSSSPQPTSPMSATTAAADKTSEPSEAAAGSAVVGTPEDNPTSSGSPAKTAVAAAPGDSASVSPSRGKQPPAPAWTCVKTGRELSGAVQAFRENVAGSVAAGTWRPRPRPRVIKHMGTADQSVRLLNHEISEMQRWEASFRGGDGSAASPPTKAAPSPGSAGTLEADPDSSTATGGTLSDGDGNVSSPPRLRSSATDLGSSERRASDTNLSDAALNTTGRGSTSSAGLGTDSGARSGVTTGSSSAPSTPIPEGVSTDVGSQGRGVTAPYRLLCESVTFPGELDRHFLSGSSASDLGVTVMISSTLPILGSAVARCLWESHWREEWAVLLPSHVACYMPLSKKPAWVLPLRALHKASAVSDERCPLPGLRCLCLETIGRAHYLCFTSRTSRDTWLAEILRLSKGGIVDPPSALELSQDPRELYVLKTAQWRMPPRLVLNARRPGFDLSEDVLQKVATDQQQQHQQQQQQQPWELAAEALRSAFKVHADPGNQRLVPFLDLASAFRKVDLSRLDLDSDEALCFFGNLYHLLVRHMLLVLGAPSSAKEWPSRFAEVSYEVGGDVFSLQELEHCVLRGKLPRPSLKDFPKRFAPLPPELDDHYAYRLGKADARISLFLNNASQSNPTSVVLLSPENVDEQLNRACQAFVDHTVKTDVKRRQILVHKVFQLYARDLQPRATSTDMVRYGLRFAGKAVVHGLSALDVNISQAHIRYHPYLLKCHEAMRLVDLTATTYDALGPSER